MKYIGIDISKAKHTCGAVDESGDVIRKSREYANNREGLSGLAEFLRGKETICVSASRQQGITA